MNVVKIIFFLLAAASILSLFGIIVIYINDKIPYTEVYGSLQSLVAQVVAGMAAISLLVSGILFFVLGMGLAKGSHN